MTTESQNKSITDHMLRGKTVTQLDAYKLFGCVNLSGRISEISKTHSITKEWVKTKTGKRVIRYGIAFILSLFMLSCDDMKKEERELNVVYGLGNDRFYVVTVDSCEYVVFHGNGRGNIVHKENCKNHSK